MPTFMPWPSIGLQGVRGVAGDQHAAGAEFGGDAAMGVEEAALVGIDERCIGA